MNGMTHLLIPAALGAVGVYVIYRGATLLIDNATSLARNIGLPVVVIGVTIIAFGTSLPELVVGIVAGASHQSDIVLGNILGSNMANLGLVLGMAAFIRPVAVPSSSRFETYTMLFATSVLYLMVLDGRLGRLDGLVLIALGIIFTFVVVRRARRSHIIEQAVERAVTVQHRRERSRNILGILAATALLFVGARMLVSNAEALAKGFGVSDVLIGITLVAVGTSLPEIVTSVVASVRKDSSLIVGNIVGSNVLNIMLVLGITVLISPVNVGPSVWQYDLPVLLGASLVAISFFRTGRTVSRIEAVLLLSGYTAYVLFAFAAHTGHMPSLPA